MAKAYMAFDQMTEKYAIQKPQIIIFLFRGMS